MKCLHRSSPAAWCASLALASGALASGAPAQALGRLAEISIVDRDSGTVLTPVYCRGEYWVAGRPGARYAIEIRNRLGERMLAVTSVDGINVVTGASASWDQAGYVFGPGEQYRITGWRKSTTAVAAFTFTDASRSYADLTGRPANVGVIGVALFRERPAPMTYAAPLVGEDSNAAEPPARAQDLPPLAESAARAAGAPAAGASALPGPDLAQRQVSPQAPSAPKLGTGHGEREYSYVSRTEFARQQPQPNEIVRIRYDSLENLLAMGIVPRPRPVPSPVSPFPGSSQGNWVPDPPG